MKRTVFVSLVIQTAFIVSTSLLILWFDKVLAYSYMLGGLVFIFPNLYFTIYAFRYIGARSASNIARSLKWGESGKFALVAVGFALVFKFVSPLQSYALFAGFCSLVVLQWFIASKIVKQISKSEIS